MVKKLGIVLMAGFFGVSVAGLSFADEKAHGTAPATTAAPANPCADKGTKKTSKKAADKKATDKKAEEASAAPASTPAPAAKK